MAPRLLRHAMMLLYCDYAFFRRRCRLLMPCRHGATPRFDMPLMMPLIRLIVSYFAVSITLMPTSLTPPPLFFSRLYTITLCILMPLFADAASMMPRFAITFTTLPRLLPLISRRALR